MISKLRDASQTLSVGEKCAYAAGDAASSLYWKTFEYFLLFYYTDIFGISAGSVATMLLITRIGDALIDPFMGMAADRTRSRWGRFRPYLLWCSFPLPLIGVITFTTPHLSPSAKLLYAYVTYTLLMLAYTAVNIPYTALLGVLSANSQERTAASSWRFAVAFLATIFVQKYTTAFAKRFGYGNEALGWQRTMLLYGALALVMFLICFLRTRERVLPLDQQTTTMRESFAVVLRSRSWRLLFASVVLILTAYGVRGAASAYYFKYFLRREDLLGGFLVANGISALLGIVLMPTLARAVGKRNSMILCCASGAAVFGMLWAARPDEIWLVFGVQVLSSVLIGPIAPLFFAMFADVADESEWVSRKRITGLFFASALFAIKIGAAIGGSTLGLALSFGGYISNAQQSLHSLQAIAASMSWIPAALLLTAGVLLYRYNLTEPALKLIEDDLMVRRQEELPRLS